MLPEENASRPLWMNKEFLAKLKHKKNIEVEKKKGWVTWVEYRVIQVQSFRFRKLNPKWI